MEDRQDWLLEYLDAAHGIARDTISATLDVAGDRDFDAGRLLQLVQSQLMGTAHTLMLQRKSEQ